MMMIMTIIYLGSGCLFHGDDYAKHLLGKRVPIPW